MTTTKFATSHYIQIEIDDTTITIWDDRDVFIEFDYIDGFAEIKLNFDDLKYIVQEGRKYLNEE